MGAGQHPARECVTVLRRGVVHEGICGFARGVSGRLLTGEMAPSAAIVEQRREVAAGVTGDHSADEDGVVAAGQGVVEVAI